MNSVLQYIRSLVAEKKAEGESDQFLLRRFVCERDETAFAALLQRHGPMAMGVCRRILRNKHLAEDAFQATFLILALKAGELCKRGFVPGWLYCVAVRLARKLKAQTSRSQPTAVSQSSGQVCRDGPMEAISAKRKSCSMTKSGVCRRSIGDHYCFVILKG